MSIIKQQPRKTSSTPATKFVVYDSFNNAIYIEESFDAAQARLSNWPTNRPGDIGDLMVMEVVSIYRPVRQRVKLQKLAETEVPAYFDNE